jgi:hypothetical protein
MRNLFLDRNLLVPTMANDGSAFFQFVERKYKDWTFKALGLAQNVGDLHGCPVARRIAA